MQVHGTVAEPAAAAAAERFRANDLDESEYVDVELSRAPLLPVGDDELDVLEAEEVRGRSEVRQCAALVDQWAEAALRLRRDIIILVHGGPVAEPADAEFILRQTKNCHGFYGASSMERLPTERALTEQTRRFKAIKK